MSGPRQNDVDAIDIAATILQKIALSNWMLTFAFLQRDFYSMHLDCLELGDLSDYEVSQILEDLEWSRNTLGRCYFIVRRNLFQLSIPQSDEKCFDQWQHSQRNNKQLLRLDWIFLFHELQEWKEDTERQLNTKMTDIEIRDSKRIDQLTKLGQFLLLFFTPVGLAYGLLSMGGDFAPGNDKFWVFFIIAIPLVICTVFAFWGYLSIYPKYSKLDGKSEDKRVKSQLSRHRRRDIEALR
jgi:hypothetical protein